jgi:hypothetical protein
VTNLYTEMRLEAQARVVGLLNEIEWRLGYLGEDKEEVKKLLEPLYEMTDKE